MTNTFCCDSPVITVDEKDIGYHEVTKEPNWRGLCLACGYEGWFHKSEPDAPGVVHKNGEDPTYTVPTN